MAGALKIWDGSAWQTLTYGTAGTSLPAGGATNSLLAKQSAADSDAMWTTAPIIGSVTTNALAVTSLATFSGGKIGFFNATPVAQSKGWDVLGSAPVDKQFNTDSTSLTEIAQVLGTLINALRAYGILGS